MLRILSVVAALQTLAWTSALACTGQVGAVIFQDNFADATGGWDATVKPPVFLLSGNATSTGSSSLNLTFNAIDGDYCMDFILPPAIATDNPTHAAIIFWATSDYNNMMELILYSDGTVQLSKELASNWSNIFSVPNVPGFNSAPNAVNSLRVTALAGTITAYLNGKQVQAVRAQEPPSANSSFGVDGGDATAVANPPPIQIKGYSVTAGK
jgi:hypothetical protein